MQHAVLRFKRANAGVGLFLLGMLLFRSAVADWYQIPSGSMEPTLAVGDRVVVDKRAFSVRLPFTDIHLLDYAAPRAGDIITFTSPVDGERLIKRVVAVAGDSIEAQDGILFVNGVAQAGHAGKISFRAGTVPSGHVFVMGDHRDNSFDSRFWGPLALSRVQGKALRVAFSFDGLTPRSDRVWMPLAEHAP